MSTWPAWIAVEDKLPPKNMEVLIAFRGSSLPATGQYTGSKRDHNGWCYPSENSDWGSLATDWTVTHWMPLPKHPNHLIEAAGVGESK